MPHDPRVTAYIEKAAPFAQPILNQVREAMHRARPDFDEAIKWGMPFFVLNGAPIANMAAFKAHAAFGFWKREVPGVDSGGGAMERFSQLTSVADLPDEAALAGMVAEAVAIAEAGGKSRRTVPGRKPVLEVPADLQAAFEALPGAAAGFAVLPAGARREYLEWVLGAKQAVTRAKRVGVTATQVAEGKKLNWKYEGC